jgi:DNA-binding GntR family transcriptional regulator
MDSKSSQRDLAYGVLRRAILLGHTKHGTRINERIVAEKLGISRVPVREALLCLHGEGLISKSKRGLQVTELSAEEVSYQQEFRAIIECAAVRLAAGRITDGELERLRELVDQQRILELAREHDAFRESDLMFHQLLLKATHNPFLIRLSGSLALGPIMGQVEHGGVAESHRRILDAVSRGDADEAEDLMYEHVTRGPLYADEVSQPRVDDDGEERTTPDDDRDQ